MEDRVDFQEGESGGRSWGTVSFRQGMVRIGGVLISWLDDEFSGCALQARLVHLLQT